MSADFMNFGAAAMNIAGTAAIVGETTKMLRGAQKTVACRHCGSHEHKTNQHPRKHKEHHEPHRTGHTSKGDDYAFDFRI